MLAHQGRDTSTLSRWRHNVAAIAHVCAQARLVRLDEVGSQYSPIRVASYQGPCRHFDPGAANLLLRTLWRERVRVARAHDLLQDRPNPGPVRLAVLTNLEHSATQTRPSQRGGSPTLQRLSCPRGWRSEPVCKPAHYGE